MTAPVPDVVVARRFLSLIDEEALAFTFQTATDAEPKPRTRSPRQDHQSDAPAPRSVAMTAPVQVIEIRRLDGSGNLKAFAKVKLGSVIIHGCHVIQQPGQKAWLALPQTPGRAKADGSGVGRFPVVEITNLIERDFACLDRTVVASRRWVRVRAGVRS